MWVCSLAVVGCIAAVVIVVVVVAGAVTVMAGGSVVAADAVDRGLWSRYYNFRVCSPTVVPEVGWHCLMSY